MAEVFFNIPDLASINAWILSKQTTGENISRQDFLLKLAVELGADFREAREQPKQIKNTKGSLPKSTTDAYQRWLKGMRDEGSDHPSDPQNLGGTEPNHSVTYMVLKVTANDRCKSPALCRNEFRRFRSDTVR
ncbi:uncharacterized protein TNCV_3030451 [Trichonephila clavipes]|nr:uncharacterized protein TNCV_3030451 [Trichonephila clavipes]